MTSLDTSRGATATNPNLPFYLSNEISDEEQCNFICFRLKGNLTYNNIISGGRIYEN